jgi:hypothetical protein
MEWKNVQSKIELSPQKLSSLFQMESTGWEPDVIDFDQKTGEYIFCDCSQETPKWRKSICYDKEALDSRKEFKPENSAIEMASEMWVEILSEAQYRYLQTLWNFDTKTSSWILTPPDIRKLWWAIFADFRYGNVFVYHNWASSYYNSRWFRGLLRV